MAPLTFLRNHPALAGVFDVDVSVPAQGAGTADDLAQGMAGLLDAAHIRNSFHCRPYGAAKLGGDLSHSWFEPLPKMPTVVQAADISTMVQDVAAKKGINITVCEVGVPQHLGMVVLKPGGEAIINVSANLPPLWKRFFVATELMHIQADEPGRRTSDIDALLYSMVRAPSLTDPYVAAGDQLAQRSLADQYQALDMLYPQAARSSMAQAVAAGNMTLSQVGHAVALPEALVRVAHGLMPKFDYLSYVYPKHPKAAATKQVPVGPVGQLLEQGGGAYRLEDAARVLNVTTDDVVRQIESAKMLGIQHDHEWLLPVCQFNLKDGRVEPAVQDVLSIFGERHPLAVLQFLVTGDTVLGGKSPLQAIGLGGPWTARVHELALAHQGDGFA